MESLIASSRTPPMEKDSGFKDYMKDQVDSVLGLWHGARAFERNKDAIASLQKVTKFWNSMDPHLKRALMGTLAIGGTHMLFSAPSIGQSMASRMTESLGAGAIGGLGLYGLSQTGAYDKAKEWLTQNNPFR